LRQRAGILIGTDSISYSCFNCGFRASWQHGRTLSGNFKKLLTWLNVPNDEIIQCIRESLMLKDDIHDNQSSYSLMPKFFNRTLPEGSKTIQSWLDGDYPNKLIKILEYMQSRSLYIDDYDWYWSDAVGYEDRLIIPFTYYNRIVGYTARTIDELKIPKYLSEQQVGYVFNIDRQTPDKQFVIVVEGPMDAISIDGVSLMGSTVSGGQHLVINQLQKEVIVVPDRDSAGRKLIETAISMNWSVSFPDWSEDVKDVNDAIKQYGRLYTLYSIIQGKKSDNCTIRTMENIWFK
jgi:hypothetical protein